jgi:hypothetical protein
MYSSTLYSTSAPNMVTDSVHPSHQRGFTNLQKYVHTHTYIYTQNRSLTHTLTSISIILELKSPLTPFLTRIIHSARTIDSRLTGPSVAQ